MGRIGQWIVGSGQKNRFLSTFPFFIEGRGVLGERGGDTPHPTWSGPGLSSVDHQQTWNSGARTSSQEGTVGPV